MMIRTRTGICHNSRADPWRTAMGAAIGGVTGGILGGVDPGIRGYVAAGMMGAGAGAAYATGGTEGLMHFGAGLAGAFVGYAVTPYVVNGLQGYGFKSNSGVIKSFVGEGQYQKAIDFAVERYGIASGTYNPNDPYFTQRPGVPAYTDAATGQVTYGPAVFIGYGIGSIQAAGFHEWVHVGQVKSGQIVFNDYQYGDQMIDQLANRTQIEMEAYAKTIQNAWRLDIHDWIVQRLIREYNAYATESHLPSWEQ